MQEGDEPGLYDRVPHGTDPAQCEFIVCGGSRQCNMLQIEGTRYCKIHQRPGPGKSAESKARRFAAGIWSDKVADEAANPQIKDLRTEIGILRVMLAERLQQAKTPLDLMVHSQALGDLVAKIERVVLSCNKIEKDLGSTMDQTQVMQFAAEVLEIVADALEDVEDKDDLLETISDAILARLEPR